jgi:hypothetical protein
MRAASGRRVRHLPLLLQAFSSMMAHQQVPQSIHQDFRALPRLKCAQLLFSEDIGQTISEYQNFWSIYTRLKFNNACSNTWYLVRILGFFTFSCTEKKV